MAHFLGLISFCAFMDAKEENGDGDISPVKVGPGGDMLHTLFCGCSGPLVAF